MHMRRRALADNHVLGDSFPHHRQLLDAVGSCRPHLHRRLGSTGRRLLCLASAGTLGTLFADRSALNVAKDVVLGYAATDARARDLSDVYVVLFRDAADQRRRTPPAVL